MGDDITIGVTEIVNNIEVTAQPNDQIIDIDVIDNSDSVTLNVTPTLIEVNIERGGSFARWGTIYGSILDQTDLQNALFNKADLVNGLVPASQLPSFVDDVIEVANFASLPTAGEIGKIYITLDNNKIYRWGGSTYVEIAANNAVWGAITGTLSNQTDLQNALNLKANISGQVFTGAISATNLSGTNTGDQTLSGLGGVPDSRTLTINGVTFDLTANRSWTINSGIWGQITGTLSNQTDLQNALDAKQPLDADLTAIAALSGTSGLLRKTAADTWSLDTNTYATTSQLHNAVTLGTANGLSLSNQVLSLAIAGASANGALSSFDWNTFNNKQNQLNGTGIVRFSGITPSYISGTNNQFVKGDGSLDSNVYVTTSGASIFTNQIRFDNDIYLKQDSSLNYISGYTVLGADTGGLFIGTNTTRQGYLAFNNLTSPRSYSFPDISGTFVLANSTTGNVGIGTTSPSVKLEVFGGNAITTYKASHSGINGGFDIQNTGSLSSGRDAQIRLVNGPTFFGANDRSYQITNEATSSSTSNLVFQYWDGSNYFPRLLINSTGSLGILGGGDIDNAVYDKISLGHFHGNYGWIQTWSGSPLYLNKIGNAVYAGTQRIDNNSDERIKENIVPIENALNTILSLNGKKYNMLDENNILRYGFVAQEVKPYLSDFVTESDRKFEKDNVKIENLLTLESSGSAWAALLVEAIKEQNVIINELKSEIDLLKQKA